MINKTTHLIASFVSLTAIVAGIAFLVLGQASQVSASAPSGLPATVATTSQTTLSTTALTLFATSTCAARIITTSANPIMLTFSDVQGSVPTGAFGTIQSASTTVVYDSGQFGCGAIKGYSFASQVITLVESR